MTARPDLAARVRALLADGPDTWTPYDSRDTGQTFLAESVLDFTAELRALLDSPDTEPAEDGDEVEALAAARLRVAGLSPDFRPTGADQ